MKLNILFLVLANIIFISTLFAQKKSGYTEQWIKKNESRLEKVTFDELSKIPASHQRNIFTLLPNSTKSNIWKQKVDLLLKQSFSKEQLEHLKTLYIFATEKMFTPDGLAELDPQMQDWAKKAETHFSNEDIFLIVSSMSITTGIGADPNHGVACTCSVGSWLSCKDCARKENNPCLGSGDGCGFFWGQPCDGTCPKK